MKQTARFLLAAILFTSVSCSDNKADVKGVTADKETSKALAADNKAQQHKATVKAFYDAMNMHDLKAASTHLAPGYKEYADNVTEPAASDSSANLIRDWLTAFPDFKSDTKEIVADDNVVMIWSDQSATWKG